MHRLSIDHVNKTFYIIYFNINSSWNENFWVKLKLFSCADFLSFFSLIEKCLFVYLENSFLLKNNKKNIMTCNSFFGFALFELFSAKRNSFFYYPCSLKKESRYVGWRKVFISHLKERKKEKIISHETQISTKIVSDLMISVIYVAKQKANVQLSWWRTAETTNCSILSRCSYDKVRRMISAVSSRIYIFVAIEGKFFKRWNV